jgi:hypothetical protein
MSNRTLNEGIPGRFMPRNERNGGLELRASLRHPLLPSPQCGRPTKGDEQNQTPRLSRTFIMKPKNLLRAAFLIVAWSAFSISLAIASDKNEAKHSSKITKARAEQIALTKVPGGRIRSAELATARGQRFWSVYIAKPGAKNAKEIRVDAISGHIIAVQTERPEDQAEEPSKTH